MGEGVSQEQFKKVIAEYWRKVFNFAFRMTLDRERARSLVEEAYLRAYVGQEKLPEDPASVEPWLLRIAYHVMEQNLPRSPEVSFDVLDETLRSEATRTDVVRSLEDPERDFLLWELKQGCMTAVINCLSPGERAAFIVSNILRLSDDDAAASLGVSKSAYKVRLSRARKKVSDYLAPRCEHVDPMNPCRCPARVGTAMKNGFIRSGGQVNLRKPVEPFGRYGSGQGGGDAPLREISSIYGSLPEPDPPEELPEELCRRVDSGEWEQVRAQKQQGA